MKIDVDAIEQRAREAGKFPCCQHYNQNEQEKADTEFLRHARGDCLALVAEVRRLQDAWTRCEHEVDKGNIAGNVQARRAEKAEARVAVLRDALQQIRDAPAAYSDGARYVAKRALATIDAAAERMLEKLKLASEIADWAATEWPNSRTSEAWRLVRGEGTHEEG